LRLRRLIAKVRLIMADIFEAIRGALFTEIVPGVGLLKVPDRAFIRLLAIRLDVWDKIASDLREVKTMSQRRSAEDATTRARAVASAESPYATGVFDSGWLIVYTDYEDGVLKRTEAMLVVGFTKNDRANAAKAAEQVSTFFTTLPLSA
jgi:hypothetical protein